MKSNIIGILVIIGISACTDVNFMMEEQIDKDYKRESRINDVANSELLDNWEQVEYITLRDGNVVVSPWKPFASTTFDAAFALDIKKEDGWEMLFHSMKNGVGFDDRHNYMFFYNRLKGFLKVLYYESNDGTPAQNAMWHFQSSDNTALLNLSTFVALPDNIKQYGSISISNASTLPTSGFSGGWNGFELEVPFTRDYKDVLFKVAGSSKRIMRYNYSGVTQQEIQGTIVKNIQQSNGRNKAVAIVGGKGVKELITNLKDDSNQKSCLGKKILDLLSNVSSENISSAILKGLGSIFGTTTVLDTQYVSLSSSGTIELKGEGVEDIPGSPLGLSNIPLYEVMNNPKAMTLDSHFSDLVIKDRVESLDEERFMGVWTLMNEPIIQFNRYSKVIPTFIESDYIQRCMLDFPYFYSVQMQMEFNPNLKPYITDYSVSTQVIKVNKMNGESIECSNFMGIETDLIYSDEDMELYQAPFSNSILNSPLVVGSYVPEGYDYYYKWGEEAPTNLFVVITVNMDYLYNGKPKNLVSSRIYKAKCTINTDLEKQTFLTGKTRKPYIVNTGEYPFGN